MSKDLLTVRDLSVRVEEKNILKSLNLSVKPGETHVLMGPNGAGKSTLGNTLMGNPHYEVIGGSVEFQGQNLLDLPVNERAKAGIFMSFQNPLEVLNMDPSYADRDLNVGFSGGEKKKAEILQLLMLKPSLAILDETDSGLDVDAVRTVSRGIEEYQKDKDSALIIITHNMGILSSLKVDKTHVLVKGSIVADGDGSLVEEINREGFAKFENKE